MKSKRSKEMPLKPCPIAIVAADGIARMATFQPMRKRDWEQILQGQIDF